MATLQTEKFRFIHLPKSGGCWVQSVITRLGIPFEVAPRTHANHLWGDQSLPSFAFARDPFTWYISAYQWHRAQNWDLYPELRGATFGQFFDHQCRETPYSEIVADAIGMPPVITYLARYEFLQTDLMRALHHFGGIGLETSARAIASVPPENVSPRLDIELTAEQRRLILLNDWNLILYRETGKCPSMIK